MEHSISQFAYIILNHQNIYIHHEILRGGDTLEKAGDLYPKK